jgi:hypothetical protein
LSNYSQNHPQAEHEYTSKKPKPKTARTKEFEKRNTTFLTKTKIQ